MGKLDNKAGAERPPLSFEHTLQEDATQAAMKSLGKVLWGLIEINPNRPIQHLSEDELTWMAIAAISGWVLKRAEQAKALKLDVDQLIDAVPELAP